MKMYKYHLPSQDTAFSIKSVENKFGHGGCFHANISPNLWACWVHWKAAGPVPNGLDILGRRIQLGTVGRPKTRHNFSISCHCNIPPQYRGIAGICIHLDTVCRVGILCCCCRVGFHCCTGHVHLHLQGDTCLTWESDLACHARFFSLTAVHVIGHVVQILPQMYKNKAWSRKELPKARR